MPNYPNLPLQPQDTLDQLIVLFPDFAEWWNRESNLFREDDGSFTHCGVFSEFGRYFYGSYARFTPEQLADLGRFVNTCADSTDSSLADAATTCFLENIAGEDCSAAIQYHLKGEALRFYKYWHEF